MGGNPAFPANRDASKHSHLRYASYSTPTTRPISRPGPAAAAATPPVAEQSGCECLATAIRVTESPPMPTLCFRIHESAATLGVGKRPREAPPSGLRSPEAALRGCGRLATTAGRPMRVRFIGACELGACEGSGADSAEEDLGVRGRFGDGPFVVGAES